MQRKTYRLKAGNINNLKLVEEDLPGPAGNEATVEVKAIGLNFADVSVILGLYSATPKGEFTPGLEYAGVVSAVGRQVGHLKPGDRVMGISRFGGYSTHLNIDARYLVPIPDGWTMEEGAAYLVQVLTAYYALVPLGNLRPGMTVLVHSAAGGVGILANRIAKKLGAFTIGTVGSSAKLSLLKEEGVDEPIVRDENFYKNLDKILENRELNLIMETQGGKMLMELFKRLAPEGRSIVYSAADFITPGNRPNYLKIIWKYLRRPLIDPMKLTDGNRGILGFNLIYLYEKIELMHQYLEEIGRLNIGKPRVGHVMDFDNLTEAVRLLQSGKTTGKVIVKT
ncbi:MAG: zinc-binding dehydrogenase [Lewinellaceae bacterium]|nr:zinc-binding dehydrogenase [Lewinellaceae bacterium]